MYDVHFKYSKKQQGELLEAGKPPEAHFRVYSIAEEAGRKMLDRSIWDPKLKLPAPGRSVEVDGKPRNNHRCHLRPLHGVSE